MDHSQIIAQIIKERVINIAISHFKQVGVVPEGRELVPGDAYFNNNVYVRARSGMKQYVDVLKGSGFTPKYRAHGVVSAEFYGEARAYVVQLDYSFLISLEDVMSVIASQAEAKLRSEGFEEDEEE